MPKLWTATVDAHRHAVREKVMEAAWDLVSERGLPAVTMSQIAEAAGIGRATLYKYFPDVTAILIAWHQRHVTAHLEHLTSLTARPGPPEQRLTDVLHAYAHIRRQRHHHGTDLVTLLHADEPDTGPQHQLHDLVRDLITAAADAGAVRDDVPADELASYCLHALTAAADLPSDAPTDRLVTVVLAGLRPATPSSETAARH